MQRKPFSLPKATKSVLWLMNTMTSNIPGHKHGATIQTYLDWSEINKTKSRTNYVGKNKQVAGYKQLSAHKHCVKPNSGDM